MDINSALWTPAEDKALKSEALRCVNQQGGSLPIQLTMWLDFHGAPTLAIPHNPSASKGRRSALLAQLVAKKTHADAKKARADRLQDLRTKAIKASASQWPRPHCHPQHKHNLEAARKKREEEEGRKAAEHAKERALIDARVAFLMKMREAGRKGGVVCTPPRLFSRNEWAVTANSPPSKIQSLQFEDPSVDVDPRVWSLIFPQMANLWFLGIARPFPLSMAAVSALTCRLTTFEAMCSLYGNWGELICSQPGIDELILHSKYIARVPAADQLPRLRRLRAHPRVVSRFAEIHQLVDVWFCTGEVLGKTNLSPHALTRLSASPSRLSTVRISAPDFLLALAAAPALFSMLEHLVLDEHMTWSDFTVLSHMGSLANSTFGEVACALDCNVPYLRSLFLLCSHTTHSRAHRRRLSTNDAECFARVLASNSRAPGLLEFLFYAMDGYAIWTGWGQEDEKLSYLGLAAHRRIIRQDENVGTRMDKVKKKKKSLKPFVPAMRPSPVQSRPRPSAHELQKATEEKAAAWAFPDTEAAARWFSAIDDLTATLETKSDHEADATTDKKTLEEDVEKQENWERVVAVAVEMMREPDRRHWFRDKRMQEEQEEQEHLQRGERYTTIFFNMAHTNTTNLWYGPSYGFSDGEGAERWWPVAMDTGAWSPPHVAQSEAAWHAIIRRLLSTRTQLAKTSHQHARGLNEHMRWHRRIMEVNERLAKAMEEMTEVDDEGDEIPGLIPAMLLAKLYVSTTPNASYAIFPRAPSPPSLFTVMPSVSTVPSASSVIFPKAPSELGPWFLSDTGFLSRDYNHLCEERKKREFLGGKVIANVNHPIFAGCDLAETLEFLPLCPHLKHDFIHRRGADRQFQRNPLTTLYYVVNGVYDCIGSLDREVALQRMEVAHFL
ncbi:hypothetical protein K438DRAFT_1764565 [Mycena galopus ATCC 62051]|nr:hypothetical protein K438DRAFT_1764565 [Mycena galopus ATCC 62051]